MSKMSEKYDIYCGIDIGKSSNYVVALESVGEKRILSHSLCQNESEIRQVFENLLKRGKTLVTVDQYGSIGKFVVAIAHDMNLDVAHISPRSFRKIAETYDESKTDALDAYIIADVSRSTPRLISPLGNHSEVLEEIKVLISARDDIVKERTAHYNRLHDLLCQVCPALEMLFYKEKLHADLPLRLLKRYGGPCGFRRSGKVRVSKWASNLKYHSARGPHTVEEIFLALSTMTVTLPASEVIESQIKRIASRTLELEADEKEIGNMIDRRTKHIPEIAILKSMPGIGDVYSAVIATEIADIDRFKSSSHLASYGGVAPVRHESGNIKKSKRRKGGNRRLKNALIRSADIAR
jgi:transposase